MHTQPKGDPEHVDCNIPGIYLVGAVLLPLSQKQYLVCRSAVLTLFLTLFNNVTALLISMALLSYWRFVNTSKTQNFLSVLKPFLLIRT